MLAEWTEGGVSVIVGDTAGDCDAGAESLLPEPYRTDVCHEPLQAAVI